MVGQGVQQEQEGTDLYGYLFGTPPSIGTFLVPKAPVWDIFVASFSRAYISHSYANSYQL